MAKAIPLTRAQAKAGIKKWWGKQKKINMLNQAKKDIKYLTSLNKAAEAKKDVTLPERPEFLSRKPAGVLRRGRASEDLTQTLHEEPDVEKDRRYVVLQPPVKVLVGDDWSDDQLLRQVMVHLPCEKLTDVWIPMTVGQMLSGKAPAIFSEKNGERIQTVIGPPPYEAKWQTVTTENNLHPRAFLQKPWGYLEPRA